MSSIKIVRVITRLVGGSAQHVALLTAGLNGGIFESKLVVGKKDDHEIDMSFLADTHGVHRIHVGTMRNGTTPLKDLRSFWHLYRLLKREKPAIAHLHLLKARFWGGLAAKLARVPVIIETFHGNLFSGYYGRLKTAAIVVAERFLGWFIMNRVIAISETQKDELIRHRICPPEKIHVIPLGLDLGRFANSSKFRGEMRNELGVSNETILLGAVGRLVPIKGLTYLLNAIYRVTQSTNRDFCLLIVGDGPLRQDLQSQASALGIEKHVRFLGWRFDLEKIYADLDIGVASSLNEGTPVSLIEAMAAGKAVVATKVGGVSDVVEDGVTGLLVPPKDPEVLADAIQRLLKDAGLRERLGEQAKKSVHPKYNVSRLIHDMKDLYLTLVPSNGGEE